MLRVLVAEDHAIMREKVVATLKAEFAVVASVADGQAMLETESETDPDVVVLDISMPVMNGLEAASELAHRASRARIVFLTAHEDPAFLAAAMAAGGLGYVIKSRMASDLRLAVREAACGRAFVSPCATLTAREGAAEGKCI
jgi:DNA-binding NarL/FixJ family response regulator